MKIFLTNDDGVNSPFLPSFIEAFISANIEVYAVFPEFEQSWIGRAYSRHKTIELKEINNHSYGENCHMWTVSGTPSDCANIALNHIFDFTPNACVSGLNIGFNATMPLSLSSGTIAGTIECASNGISSFAFSKALHNQYYEDVRISHTMKCQELIKEIEKCAKYAAEIVLNEENLSKTYCVHNINFPENLNEKSIIEKTSPLLVSVPCLFKRDKENPNFFSFAYAEGKVLKENPNSDIDCLKRSNISHSILKV